MIVIGADTHKQTHTLVAVEMATGRRVATKTISAREDGMLDGWRWARDLHAERVWAIEDCRHVSGRLERCLIAQGERVARVPPKLMGQTRRGQREAGKSDEIDATAVARAAVEQGIESLPTAWLDDRAMEIRLLTDHREDLVGERTRLINRLRWHLVELDDTLESSLAGPKALSTQRTVERLGRRLAGMRQTARTRIARDELRRIRELTRAERALEREIRSLVADYAPQLLDEPGCGTLTAATLIGRTAGAARFRSDGHFARHAGAAPIPASSGSRQRVRLNRGGDRQLNRALHVIAINRAYRCPETRAYLERKQAEGKTRTEALRCLKRHLARRFYLLMTTNTDPQPVIAGTAPTTCLT